MDSRIWEIFDENKKSLGYLMKGDLIHNYTSEASGQVLRSAFIWMRHLNYTWKIVGDLYPLEADSDNPIIQNIKIAHRKHELKREKNRQRERKRKIAKKNKKKIEQDNKRKIAQNNFNIYQPTSL